MSQFINAGMLASIQMKNDRRLLKLMVGNRLDSGLAMFPKNGRAALMSFRSPWWPRSGFMGDQATDYGPQYLKGWSLPQSTKGRNARFGYQGVTRDAFNSPLGGCTVKLFLTADDSKVTPDITSDALSGEYVIGTPFYAPHWIKVKKAGSPDVQGVSVDNIYPNT